MTTDEPTVREWQRIMAANAHGHENLGGLFEPKVRGGWEHRHADDGKMWAHPNDIVCYKDIAPPQQGQSDPVSLPPHYRHLPVEAIDITEHFNFCMGNALKYIWRADHKGKPVEDLEKARWYIDREIERRKREQ